MVQSWYQGGVSVWDFTDSRRPHEIGYFERGALPGNGIGGTWSAYYYNGYVFSSDIAKGFDVLKIRDGRTDPPERVRMGTLNVQSQPTYRCWDTPPVHRAHPAALRWPGELCEGTPADDRPDGR
jgi:hypothetical protein